MMIYRWWQKWEWWCVWFL